MNWVSKFDDVVVAFKDQAVLHWELAAVIGLIGASIAILMAVKDPGNSDSLRHKARQLRYCHDCAYNDASTETCAIGANVGEKCGLIDETAGYDFTIPTKL